MVRLDARGFESCHNLFTCPKFIPSSPHLCLHPLPFSPPLHLAPQIIFHPMPLQQLSPPSNSKTQRKPGYHTENQSPSSLSLYNQCPSPKKSLLSVEALTGALLYVHAKIFFLEFAPINSGQPLHVCSKVLVIYYPLQVALSTTVRKSTAMYFAVTNSEKS